MKIVGNRTYRFYLVISAFLLVLGFLSTVLNAHDMFQEPEISSPRKLFGFFIIPILGIPLLVFSILSLKRPYPFMKWTHSLQIFILLITGGLAILDHFDNTYGIALILISVLLMYAYNQINLLRIFFVGLFIIAVTIAGAYRVGSPQFSIISILFDLFFLGTVAMFNMENTRKISERNKNLQIIIDELKSELLDKEKIESQITAIQLEVDEFSFTQAEKEIIRLMCDQGLSSNKGLAEHLNKSVSTIKTQLHSIYEKTGIHKRSSLIAFFKD